MPSQSPGPPQTLASAKAGRTDSGSCCWVALVGEANGREERLPCGPEGCAQDGVSSHCDSPKHGQESARESPRLESHLKTVPLHVSPRSRQVLLERDTFLSCHLRATSLVRRRLQLLQSVEKRASGPELGRWGGGPQLELCDREL